MLLYGTGSACEYFEASAGISLSDFVKTGACMSGALEGSPWVHRQRNLSEIGISPEVREATLRKLAIPHVEARNRSEEHTSELQSLMRISYAVFCWKKKKKKKLRKAHTTELNTNDIYIHD